MFHPARRTWMALLGASALLLSSCGSGQLSIHEVRGQVVYQGQPVPLAFVVFHPVDGSEQLQKLRPRGQTDKDGNFDLTTYALGDGAPAGDYKVTVAWHGPDPGTDPNDVNIEELGDKPDRLQGKYANPDQSPFQVTISKGVNTIPPFQVQ